MKAPFFDLGDGTSLPEKKVVLILNAESATVQATTRKFLRKLSETGNTVLPKRPLRQVNSLILCNAYGKDSLYSSARSAKSLAERETK
ncbi:MAG: hypothetical protein IKC69_03110 [Clostridia bacterium]|nr:hypothetical protein [Clostridia bacterium]